MADYSHHHTYRVARAHGADSRRFGWALTIAATLMLAALACVWMLQRGVDSPLPQASRPVSAVAPAPVQAKPAPIAIQTAKPSKAASVPPSDAVAASGDTRAVN